jgi:parafibromin
MAYTDAEQNDPLLALREAIATHQEPLLTSTADPNSASDVQPDLAKATHIHFNGKDGRHTFPLSALTRFHSTGNDQPVSLRTVYFAWLQKGQAVPNYINAAQRLNDELSAHGAAGDKLHNLVFVERIELTSWLDGATDDSENIKPLDAQKASALASGSAAVAAGAAGGIAPVTSSGAAASAARASKTIDPRLAEIYEGERKMADRNSILRGIKPTVCFQRLNSLMSSFNLTSLQDFSHIRKQADIFLGRNRGNKSAPQAHISSNSSLVSNLKKPSSQKRLDPIILLSPSASSLLRMSNIKQFLERGIYAPADSAAAGSSNTATLLHTQRTMSSLDPRPMRFILVDTPDQFKPDYWNRVVAVFTTGQQWQFKSYKWQNASELFAHALGIYVGWTGEAIPDPVKGWGRSVKVAAVDKWTPMQGEKGRWRDREVVEGLWSAIEESMRARGWTKDGFPA